MTIEINQDDNQVENQDEKNTSCNIFLEQLELLNQLPVNERGNVIYLALLKTFSRTNNQVENQDDNQLENQLENTYISISKSISLSKLSISVLNLLNKTLSCKIYSKNWGGKRTGSGKRVGNPNLNPTLKGPLNNTNNSTDNSTHKQQDNTRQESKKIDIYVSPEIEQIKKIYIDECTNLIPLTAYSMNKDLRMLIKEYLEDTNFDFDYFKEICKKANELIQIGDYKIDLKSIIKNHSGIYSDKYNVKPKQEDFDRDAIFKRLEEEARKAGKI